jgi:methionine-rich copper-binding protein CopC
MYPGRYMRVAFLFVVAVSCFHGIALVNAHAILLESTPSLHGSVAGPDVSLKLRFNVRIDASRSRLTLIGPDGLSRSLDTAKQSSPDTLSSEVKSLPPGSYRLRWQVLASDGHITRGEIPFSVVRS